MVNCYGKLEGNPVVAQTSVVLDQADIYTSVIVPAEQNDVELTRIQVILILINSFGMQPLLQLADLQWMYYWRKVVVC